MPINQLIREGKIDATKGAELNRAFFGILMPRVIRRCMTDYNVFMRRDRQPNMDLEASAVA